MFWTVGGQWGGKNDYLQDMSNETICRTACNNRFIARLQSAIFDILYSYRLQYSMFSTPMAAINNCRTLDSLFFTGLPNFFNRPSCCRQYFGRCAPGRVFRAVGCQWGGENDDLQNVNNFCRLARNIRYIPLPSDEITNLFNSKLSNTFISFYRSTKHH